jgi:phosphoglycerate kinase
LPSAAGFRLEDEARELERVASHPKKPVVVMMGGKKLSGKVGALLNLGRHAETVLLGGSLANLILKVSGMEIGKSEIEPGQEQAAKQVLRDLRKKIKLPIDAIVAASADGRAECVPVLKVKKHQMILDIGPETTRAYSAFLKEGKTLIWNGPMGYFENPTFAHASLALGRLFASRTKTDVYGLAGGGETLEILNRLDMGSYVDHLCAGGGAMLALLAGETLPVLEALKK